MADAVGVVEELWRFPVKSMLGERMETFEVAERGVVGDRAYALVDVEDGKIVSAKNPRKWGLMLELEAAFVDPPTATSTPPVAITFPDGAVVRSDAGDVDGALSGFLGRDVHLSSLAPPQPTMEETWPDVEGLAPETFIARTRIETDEPAERVSDINMAMAAPEGTFFDLAMLHLLSTSTLAELARLYPAGAFDVRRYRPNVLVGGAAPGFVDNGWVGHTLRLGADAAMQVALPTMRCIMTTMAQPGLERDPELLLTIARNNRITVGEGKWACAGVYGSAAAGGRLTVGDEVRLDA